MQWWNILPQITGNIIKTLHKPWTDLGMANGPRPPFCLIFNNNLKKKSLSKYLKLLEIALLRISISKFSGGASMFPSFACLWGSMGTGLHAPSFRKLLDLPLGTVPLSNMVTKRDNIFYVPTKVAVIYELPEALPGGCYTCHSNVRKQSCFFLRWFSWKYDLTQAFTTKTTTRLK